jgi:hypothetical protein
MKIIYLKIKNVKEANFVEIKNNLLWYDVVNKKMMQFQGGQLKFTPNKNNTKYDVSVEKLRIDNPKTKSNVNAIQRWIYANNISVNDYESNSQQIAIEIEEKDYERIINDLNFANIDYSE